MLIKKGNVELNINEQFLQTYLNQGYDVIDTSGKVIRKGSPNDIVSLRNALKESDNMIETLKKEVLELQSKNVELEHQLKEAKKKSTTTKTTK